MSEHQEYRRKLIEHNTAVQAALAATTEPVRQYLKRYRLDLYPLDWLHNEIAALEALSAKRDERTDAQRQADGGW